MKNIKKFRGYIYTIPKAGTYLMSEFLTQIGSQSTGWHISADHYLDTLGFDPETNKYEPSKTLKNRPYLGSFRKIPAGYHAFGHLSPLYVAPVILSSLNFKCLCVKRHPKEVLVSEFIDFRYRRRDVDFVSKERHRDSVKAFEAHIEVHGPITKNLSLSFALLEECATRPIYPELVGKDRFYFLDFKQLLSEQSGPRLAYEICEFFGARLSSDQANQCRLEALGVDNKTKSLDVELDVSREELWSERALSLYYALGFPEIADRLGYCG